MNSADKILISLIFITTLSCENKNYYIKKNEKFNHVNQKEVAHQHNIEKARSLFKEREKVIKKLFEETLDPYSGQQLQPKKCREPNLPTPLKIDNEKQLTHVTYLYASSNYSLGNCSDTDQLQKTNYELTYCKKSRMIILHTGFYNQNFEWITSASVKCP